MPRDPVGMELLDVMNWVDSLNPAREAVPLGTGTSVLAAGDALSMLIIFS